MEAIQTIPKKSEKRHGVLYHYLNYKGLFCLDILCMFVRCSADVLLPLLVSSAVNSILDGTISAGNLSYLYRIGLWMLIVTAVAVVFSLCESYFSSRIATGVGRDLRREVFGKAVHLSEHDFQNFGVSSLITRTTNDIQQIQMYTTMVMRLALAAPITLISSVAFAYLKSPDLALTILILLPVTGIAVFILSTKILPLARQQQKRLDNINQIIRENLTGVRVIRAFDNEEHEAKRFETANKGYMRVARIVQVVMGWMMPLFNLLTDTVIVIVIWWGSLLVQNTIGGFAGSGFLPGDLMAFLQYLDMIMFSMIFLSMVLVNLPRIQVSAARVGAVLKTMDRLKEVEQPGTALENTRGDLRFSKVSFAYPGGEEETLKDISFYVKSGESIAFIGSTGSGKSTLIQLIPRLFDVTEGEILLDGVDIRQYAIKDLRQKIGYVPQQGRLFTGTIEENIRYGKPSATQEEVQKAAQIAQAASFIEEKPLQYQELVAEGGGNFSGGQRQRICIARALVRQPEFYIFDDSFSALDFRTESIVRGAILEEAKKSGATVVIVGQRVSSIMAMDHIGVLDKGKLVGLGTHRELLESCEIYQQIAHSQLSKEELA